LAKVLRFSEEEALRKTTDASMRLVKVSTYLDQREAFHYSQQLRDLGLAVQVVSNSGLPGSHSRPQTGAGENLYIVNRTPRRNSSETTAPGSSRARRNSYTELFEQVLTPSNRKAGPGGIAPAPPPPPRRAPSRGPARQLSAPPELLSRLPRLPDSPGRKRPREKIRLNLPDNLAGEKPQDLAYLFPRIQMRNPAARPPSCH